MAFWTFLTFFQQVNRSTLGVSNYPTSRRSELGGKVRIFPLPSSCFCFEGAMARKPNYGLNRCDVNRAKQARQNESQRARDAPAARRRAAREGDEPPETVLPVQPDKDDQP